MTGRPASMPKLGLVRNPSPETYPHKRVCSFWVILLQVLLVSAAASYLWSLRFFTQMALSSYLNSSWVSTGSVACLVTWLEKISDPQFDLIVFFYMFILEF